MGAQVRPLFGRKALHEPRNGEETLTKQPRTLGRHEVAGLWTITWCAQLLVKTKASYWTLCTSVKAVLINTTDE